MSNTKPKTKKTKRSSPAPKGRSSQAKATPLEHGPAFAQASAMEMAVEDLLDLAALSPQASTRAQCDCGSGLAYGKCCMDRDAALGRMLRNQSDAVDEVLTYWGQASQHSADQGVMALGFEGDALPTDLLQEQLLTEVADPISPHAVAPAPHSVSATANPKNKKIEAFDLHFEALAKKERIEFDGRVTLNFAPLDGAKGTRPGSSGWRQEILKRRFVLREFYCVDPNCPCERVTLEVGTDWEALKLDSVPPLAVIKKGLFPDRKEWTASLDPNIESKISPASIEVAREVLTQVNQLLATDPTVIQRLRNHYTYIKQWSLIEGEQLQ